MTWRRYDPQHSVACRTPTRPIGWPVCPLAPDAAAPVRTDSSILMGSGCRVGRGLAALPRGPTVAAPRGRPEKTDREASRRAPGVGLAVPGLCRSALHPGLAPGSRRDPDSSSKLLSTDIATSLRGRSLTTEIFPFSFREFLRWQQAEPESPHRFGSATRAVLQHQIGAYLTTGGFPEVQELDAELRRQVLRNYVDVVILRDVVERYSISNVVALRALIRHIMSAPATRFSVNKFYHALRSQGVACTKNDLYAFLEYLTDAFLVYTAPTHARSEHVRRVNPKKVYAIDTGLLGAMAFHATEDRGALLENLVYMHLRRQGMMPEYYITQTGSEVDFVVRPEDERERHLIQVCWALDQPQTRQREVAALLSAMDELQVPRGSIVTWLDADTSDDRLTIVPAWQWLLEA